MTTLAAPTPTPAPEPAPEPAPAEPAAPPSPAPPGPAAQPSTTAERAMVRLAQLREKVWGCGFPPLPMMVTGEDGADSIASSFSFLMSVFQNTPPGWFAGQNKREFGARQLAAAIEMHEGIAAIGLVHGDTLPMEARREIYDVTCAAFRKYVSVVCMCGCGDLRFLPFEDVDSNSRVAQEARQWLLEASGLSVPSNASYSTVLEHFGDSALAMSDEILTSLRGLQELMLADDSGPAGATPSSR